MAQHLKNGWVVALLAVGLLQPVLAQSSKHAPIDLSARFSEVQADPALSASLLNTGRKVAAICANCHGEGGNSVKPEIPNLAGQNPAYLLEQVRQFADGRRRDMFMEGMIRAMNNDEKIGMVLFYSAQQVVRTPAINVTLAAKGQEYFNKVCFSCHGTDGRGSAQFPRIAGQQVAYLTQTLKNYRAGGGKRANSVMVGNTKNMTDADIDAIVAFVASMQ